MAPSASSAVDRVLTALRILDPDTHPVDFTGHDVAELRDGYAVLVDLQDRFLAAFTAHDRAAPHMPRSHRAPAPLPDGLPAPQRFALFELLATTPFWDLVRLPVEELRVLAPILDGLQAAGQAALDLAETTTTR